MRIFFGDYAIEREYLSFCVSRKFFFSYFLKIIFLINFFLFRMKSFLLDF